MRTPMMRAFTTIYSAQERVLHPVKFGACVHCGNPDGYGVSDAAPYCNDCRRTMSAIVHIPDSAIERAKAVTDGG